MTRISIEPGIAMMEGKRFSGQCGTTCAATRASIKPDGVYKMLMGYARSVRVQLDGFGPHALRATAATNALKNEADIAKVQQWLGHANISTTRVYGRRKMRPEDSPTYKVKY